MRRAPAWRARRLFGRQIDDQQTVDSGARGVGAQPLASVVKDRVVVAEQDHRNLRLLCAARPPSTRIAGQRRARGEAARGGALIGRPVGHRIGKRHAQFDQIRAARFQFEHQAPRASRGRDRRRR